MTLVAGSRAWMLDVLDHWAGRGWLRRLDIALVRFVADLSPSADAEVLLLAALTANLEGQGHACLVLPTLLTDPDGLLGWPSEAGDTLRFVLGRLPVATSDWTTTLVACDVVGGPEPAGATPFVLDGDRFYLRRYWRYERRIATACLQRAATTVDIDERRATLVLDDLFDARGSGGAIDGEPDWQKVACAVALRARITLITGGPGTGKTYTAARLLAATFATASDPATMRVALAAPTGKAAARLRQSIATSFTTLAERVGDALPLQQWAARIGTARTLHALLGTQRRSRRFRHDAAHPLDLDLLIVDEASMVHVEMMDALLAALPAHASLVLIGDPDQLSSVEAGAVLGELCGDAAAASALARQTCRLRRSERFGGGIARLALAVNAGRGDDARAAIAGDGTLAYLQTPDASDVAGRALHGYAGLIAAVAARPDSLLGEDHDAWVRTVLAAFDTFRVLCAVREGEWGVAGLNRAIERASGLAAEGDEWYEGRPVIATRNDYDLGIFNGDVGIALRASPTDPRLRVWFVDAADDESGVRSISTSRLADVETAFAMTVHRAQGSEFDGVMLVLPPESSRVVTRELLYTGITRARSRFTLIASGPAALDEAIQRTTRRSSGIGAMLRG